MLITAKARYIRMSPRKIRLVIDVVRGMNVLTAKTQLSFMKKAAALPVLKLVNSAAANAEHNFKLDPSTLYIKTITVDGGPTLDRWRARAFGRAAPIRKRTAHITVILEEISLKGSKEIKVTKDEKVTKVSKVTSNKKQETNVSKNTDDAKTAKPKVNRKKKN